MKQTFFLAFSPKSPRLAKFFIARLCGLCLLFSGSVASADFTSSDSARLQNVDITTQTISTQLSTVNQALAAQNQYWYTDHQLQSTVVALLRSVTNSLKRGVGGTDVLAGNPWWNTNSYFVGTYDFLSAGVLATGASPSQTEATKFSFPELLSFWSGQLNQPTIRGRYTAGTQESAQSFFSSDNWRSMWGVGRLPTSNNLGNYNFTWFDWMAEVQKMRYDIAMSNLVLNGGTYAPSYSALVDEVEANDTQPTNLPIATPLPQYELPEDPGLSDAVDVLDGAESTVSDIIDTLPKPRTGGSSEIVVIPEFTVGGIHVPEYRSSLSTSIVPVCRSVCSFLYGVGLFAFLFSFAKSEYSYYASLGRHWGRYH